MKKLLIILTITTASCTTLLSNQLQAKPMDTYLEKSLVAVCKSTMKGNLLKFNRTLKYYRLSNRTIANGLVCNGSDVTEFARKHGAYKIANKLDKHLHNSTSITDIAAVSKINVTFDE